MKWNYNKGKARRRNNLLVFGQIIDLSQVLTEKIHIQLVLWQENNTNTTKQQKDHVHNTSTKDT